MAKNLWNMFKIFEIIFSAWVMIMSHDKSAISLSIIAVPWFSQKSHFATHTWFSRFSYLQLKMISLCWLYSNCSYSINVKKSERISIRSTRKEKKLIFRYGGSVSQGFSRKCCYVRHNNHVFVSNANNWTNQPPKSSSTWIQRLSICFYSSFSYALVVLWCYYTGSHKKIKFNAPQKDTNC